MYSFITGRVAYLDESTAVIENQGIGYEIFVGTGTLERLSGASGEVCLYTYLNVKEDEMSLFGFLSREEKDMFLKLIGISGVGCKMAIAVLSASDATSLALSIASGDVAALSRIKGIGKKTAERIILELRGKIDFSEEFISSKSAVGDVGDTVAAEAVLALISLGLSEAEAAKKVRTLRSGAETTEQLIALALRSMDR